MDPITLWTWKKTTNSRNKEKEQMLSHALLAANRFMDMGCEQGVENPKSSTTPTGDLRIGLEQLQLTLKVKNIASLQLYGEEQASAIASKQIHHSTQFITI
ncbi:calcium-transporting ATPase 8, plasma membrane-type-like [Raphanus sativus]|uniref:Calcium-transporting ATPase 8, plasma membrane-type-like n=1 Tax=Raphanus sativus TaxID=3726 RepID=A0A6J0K9X8_RAPSA|nr:calcium-transporting ATPase 8, plasma membrane-type-like [Raphanus sativus]